MNMEERIKKLENEIKVMQEMIVWLIVTQDIFTQMKFRKTYPKLNELFKQLWK